MSATKRKRAAPPHAASSAAQAVRARTVQPPARAPRKPRATAQNESARSAEPRARRDDAHATTRAQHDAVASSPAPRVSPSALRIEDLVRMLRAMGSARASVELVQADFDAGAPVNADGTINLMHYAAWQERLG